MSIIERLTSLFAPDDCLSCGREGSLLCAGCHAKLPKLNGRCFGCHQSTIAGASCGDCLAVVGLDGLRVTADYSDLTKLLVASLKFRGNQSAARIMAAGLASNLTFPPSAVIVNMPATTSHIRQRGFDQAALIARHVSRLTGVPYTNALRRSGQHHQLGADRTQRLKQMTDALSVRSKVTGCHIIIIDDVLTTGASLHAAATVLRAAGAHRVSALVFAQA